MTTKTKAEQQVYSVDVAKANANGSSKNHLAEKYVYSFGGGKADGNDG